MGCLQTGRRRARGQAADLLKEHGGDAYPAEKRYARYLPGVFSREDLNYLFQGDARRALHRPQVRRWRRHSESASVSVGLLGTGYSIENGRYRFAQIHSGENWNPQLHAPLTQPGVNVQPGDYLLEVNGRQVRNSNNLYSFFLDTAGKQVVATVGPSPDGAAARQVTVVPVANAIPLRHTGWVARNRLLVDRLSRGQIACVYLPDTTLGSFTSFNRYDFAQVGKRAAIIDDRFNGGGSAA